MAEILPGICCYINILMFQHFFSKADVDKKFIHFNNGFN